VSAPVTQLHPVPAAPARVRLTAWQRQEIESARALVMSTGQMLAAGQPAAYVAGLIEGAANNLLDILDAVCEVS
jgi:hypothetical protein